MFTKKNKKQNTMTAIGNNLTIQESLDKLNILSNSLSNSLGYSSRTGYVSYGLNSGFIPGALAPANPYVGNPYLNTSSHRFTYPTNKLCPTITIEVGIVNLKDFQEYKREGMVSYNNMLLPFSEFYKLVHQKYNDECEKIIKESKEEYDRNVERLILEYEHSLKLYEEFNKSENVNSGQRTAENSLYYDPYYKPYSRYSDRDDINASFKKYLNSLNTTYNKPILVKPNPPIISGWTKPNVSPRLFITLIVPCDCECCTRKITNCDLEYDLEYDAATVGCFDSLSCPPEEVCIDGNCFPIEDSLGINLDNSESINLDTLDNIDSLNEADKKLLIQYIESIKTTSSCQKDYALDTKLFMLDDAIAQSYIEKIATIHDNNKELHNPSTLNNFEISAYVEKLRLETIKHILKLARDQNK